MLCSHSLYLKFFASHFHIKACECVFLRVYTKYSINKRQTNMKRARRRKNTMNQNGNGRKWWRCQRQKKRHQLQRIPITTSNDNNHYRWKYLIKLYPSSFFVIIIVHSVLFSHFYFLNVHNTQRVKRGSAYKFNALMCMYRLLNAGSPYIICEDCMLCGFQTQNEFSDGFCFVCIKKCHEFVLCLLFVTRFLFTYFSSTQNGEIFLTFAK